MQTIEEQVLKKIKDYKRGKIFFPDHFYQFGNEDAVHKALSRLQDDGELIRSGQALIQDLHTEMGQEILKQVQNDLP